MSLLSWICLAPRQPNGTASPGPPHDERASTGSKPAPADVAAPQMLLPVINTDSCIGCERCVNICPHGCLEMIWSFSTLTHPQTCCGEAHCVEACPEQIIRMAWLPLTQAEKAA